MERITQVVTQLFEKHRILIWYDEKEEVRDEFESMTIQEVEKVEATNNQFGLKYRMVREEPKQKFLVYQSGPIPDDLENWLLDVQLAHGVFRADQVALWLSELGLGFEFTDVVAPHKDFFRSTIRLRDLKALLQPHDTATDIRMKMMAVVSDSVPQLEHVLAALLSEHALGQQEKMQLLSRCNLDDAFWNQLERQFEYASESPSIEDFSLTLFTSCYAYGLQEPGALSDDALVFVNRWKESIRNQEAFEALSDRLASDLHIERDLIEREYDTLLGADLFEIIDKKVIHGLAQDVVRRSVSLETVLDRIRGRRKGHWFTRYQNLYEAIEAGARLLNRIEQVDIHIPSVTAGIHQYVESGYEVDQLYRKFVYHKEASGQVSILQDLSQELENRYANQFVLKINNAWQECIDSLERWEAPGITTQRSFYTRYIQPFTDKGKKVVVLISDALRYEAGEELMRSIRQEDRYTAEIEPLLASIPSYTQMGMASLLPHQVLSFSEKENGQVLADGTSTQGATYREKVLRSVLGDQVALIGAEELMKKNRDDSRALFRNHQVVYIYHDQIDKTGDDQGSEHRVFNAVADTLDHLITMVKKMAAANATNFLITADHGFLYQHEPLEESDFLSQEPEGESIQIQSRRFVVGKGLKATGSFKKFTSEQAGLGGDKEMLFPKSIHRLRKRGAGSRYVHGGLSLQEVVVPVIQVKKKRESDVTKVDVDFLGRQSHTITTGQVVVSFFQRDPITEKRQPRILRAGLYTLDGELISDEHELVFDFVSDNERERELKQQFILTSTASKQDGQEVLLKLLERIGESTHVREYKTDRYILRRAFGSDFDF